MSSDVFICYSSNDQDFARQLCDRLQAGGLTCWIAPRDVRTGQIYSEAIVGAIEQSQLLVLVLSQNANTSIHVVNEIEQATKNKIPILPVRIEKFELSDALDYYIRKNQFLDASVGPLKDHLNTLASDVVALIGGKPVSIGASGSTKPSVTLSNLEIPTKPVDLTERDLRRRLT